MIRPKKADAEKAKMSQETIILVKAAKDALFSDMSDIDANIIISKANEACEKDGVAKGFWVAKR